MKIVVCVKQVPRIDQVRFTRANRIDREEVEAMLNPLDLAALGHALALREEHGGEVVALTMGPPQAREVLEEAIERGADRGVHLADKRFAGADTLATARAIARAVEREEPDLVLLGRSTIDGATAQVGPQVAELAGLAHVGQATRAEVHDGVLHVCRETERGSEDWTLDLPAVVSVARGPEPPERDGGRDGEIGELDAEALGGTPRDYGTRGSPTFVKEVRECAPERDGQRLEDPGAAADRVTELLQAGGREGAPAAESGSPERARELWALAERDGDGLHPVSLESIACARAVAEGLDAEVVAILLCADAGRLPEDLSAHGADRVLVVRHERLADYEPGAHAAALCAAIEERSPFAVIAPWTAQGRDYVPRAAARLGLGLTGDFTHLEVDDGGDDEPELMWIKPAWAGIVEAPIISRTTPSLGTLRPGVHAACERRDAGDVRADELTPELSGADGTECVERRVELEDGQLLDAASVVVCVGEDADEETVEAALRLAAATGGALGATPEAVRCGLAPSQLEVGTLTRSLAPRLLVALGVADAGPLDAVRGAGTIVTVHPDPDAAAHDRADLAVVVDPKELLAGLLERLGDGAPES